jgi:DDE superfamily endonuclease
MELVLDAYQRPYDPSRPVVCTDESSKQLIDDVVAPLPVKPSQVQKEDCNYERNGTSNLFIAFEPACGQRDVTVTDRRTKCDWAHYVKKIVDEMYPQAACVTLVCDQLNTHTIASLYEAFTPDEAHRLARKLEIVHTPKHGSWLNMAEIEFSALARQCLNRRIPDKLVLTREVTAWTTARNLANTTVRWRFTAADARIKLASLYPKPLL